ncbi:hypothetical protein TNCV_2237881 [Trichonephila clavipes]|nr:hypothetical protein TNCV_2237881 [Trichonephila clavipes]
MVDHGLKVSPQPKVTRIQGFRRPRGREMPTDDSVVTKMAAEHLFHATGDVWRSTILRKHSGCITSPCLKSQNNRLFVLIMKHIAFSGYGVHHRPCGAVLFEKKRTHNEGFSKAAPNLTVEEIDLGLHQPKYGSCTR